MADHFYVLEDDYEHHQSHHHKEMDFSSPLSKGPARQGSKNNLRIHTFAKSSLHERYMSSEEEPSPSPDSETESRSGADDEQIEEAAQVTDKVADEPVEILEYRAEIAIAVPIMAIGRPKLVDITNLAPMHKRKRSLEKAPLSRTATKNAAAAAAGRGVANKENESETISPPQSKKPALSTSTSTEHLPRRQESLSDMHAPESWMPLSETDNETGSETVSTIPEDEAEAELDAEDQAIDESVVETVEGEHYFPALELRKPLSYNDYDPYSLNPPRLSPRNSYSNGASSLSSGLGSVRKAPGSIARARKQANASTPMLRRSNGRPALPRNSGSYSNQQARAPRLPSHKANTSSSSASSFTSTTSSSWRGLTRSLSMAKKQEAMHPFAAAQSPSTSRVGRETKKPKMQARGANEREELPSIPPFPFEGSKGKKMMGMAEDSEEASTSGEDWAEEGERGVTAAEALKEIL